MRGLLPALACVLAASCAFERREANPLEPDRVAQAFAARTLDDPELARFARANLASDALFPPALWDLESLTLVALFYRRELDLARAELDLAEAEVESAGARPNPTLGLDPERVLDASEPWILGLHLELPLETAGKRGLRVRAAGHRAEGARVHLGTVAWQLRSEVRGALTELERARREVERLTRAHALGTARLATVSAVLAAGGTTGLERLQSEEALAALEVEAEEARRAAEQARARLAEALGVPLAALAETRIADARGADGPDASDGDGLRALGLAQRGDLCLARAEHAAAEAELDLELARQAPDLTLAPGVSSDQGDTKLALGLALELPLFHGNQGPIAEARARLAASRARFTLLLDAASGAIERARLRYTGARAARAAAAAALTLAGSRAERTALAVEAGAEPRLSVLAAELARLERERALDAAEHELALALGALEDELQCPFPPLRAPAPAHLPERP